MTEECVDTSPHFLYQQFSVTLRLLSRHTHFLFNRFLSSTSLCRPTALFLSSPSSLLTFHLRRVGRCLHLPRSHSASSLVAEIAFHPSPPHRSSPSSLFSQIYRVVFHLLLPKSAAFVRSYLIFPISAILNGSSVQLSID